MAIDFVKRSSYFCFLFLIATTAHAVMEDSNCRLLIVESIPVNMTYPAGSPLHPSTYDSWRWIIGNTTSHLNISSFYWTLKNSDVSPYYCPTSKEGETIFNAFINLLASKKSMTIVNNGYEPENSELNILQSHAADVNFLDVTRLLGAGILHTKLWTADYKHAYLGSANMDWRSLTQVKELGVFFHNCSTLVDDLVKIQAIYRILSGPNTSIPSQWPSSLDTSFNKTNPLKMTIAGVPSWVYFAGSPPRFMTSSRTKETDAIPYVISKAKKFVYVSVMDYYPLEIHYNGGRNTFWPMIDDALRNASIDSQIEVRLLISEWIHTSPSMWNYLKSMQAIHSKHVPMNVRKFMVPGYKNSSIPYSRVNHNKYMVTDNVAYIGTSNWSGDYFTSTCGIGLVIEEAVNSSFGIRGQLEAIFNRDWNSEFAQPLTL